MNVVSSYENLIELLKLSYEYNSGNNNGSKIAGLLFARPDSFTKEEILSGIDYFNNRSSNIIDFFCVGYQPIISDNNIPVVATVDRIDWSFNSQVFDNLRRQLQLKTKWKYSGSVELLLFNSYLHKGKIKIDFSDAICIDLKKSKNDKHITSVGELFETIFIISESLKSDNPSREMSLKLIGKTTKKSIVNILFNFLPKEIQQNSKKIYSYGTSDFNR